MSVLGKVPDQALLGELLQTPITAEKKLAVCDPVAKTNLMGQITIRSKPGKHTGVVT